MNEFTLNLITDSCAAADIVRVKTGAAVALEIRPDTVWDAPSLRKLAAALVGVAGMLEA